MQTCARLLLGLGCAILATAARADSLKLENGDTLNGEIIEERDDVIVLEHPVLGVIEVHRDQLAKKPPPNPGLFGTGFMEGWTRNINLGLSGARGNTENGSLTAGLDLRAENDKRRWAWTGRYFLKTENNATTDNNARAETRYDYIFDESPWFVYVNPAYEFDDFKTWKHRVTVSGGPGYDILTGERWKLRTSLGLSGQREFAGEKTTSLSGVWGVQTEIHVWKNHSIIAGNQIFPRIISDRGEYRNLSTLTWRIRLMEKPGLDLNFGVENDYESYAPPEDKKNDLKYWGGLGLDF